MNRGMIAVLAGVQGAQWGSRLFSRIGAKVIIVAVVALITSCVTPPQLRDVSEDSVTFVSQGPMNMEEQTMATAEAQRACSAYGRTPVQQTPLFEGSCETPVAGALYGLFGPGCKDDIRRHVFACMQPDVDDREKG